jgi:predicted transcriptional regulator
MKVLLSIKPEYADKIFSGEKKFEYRKVIFLNKAVSSIVVYSTMPIGKIIGEFTIDEVITNEPEIVWNETKQHAGIKKSFFNEYFNGRKRAYAIKISNPILYKEPIDPKRGNKSFVPPQSFRYMA